MQPVRLGLLHWPKEDPMSEIDPAVAEVLAIAAGEDLGAAMAQVLSHLTLEGLLTAKACAREHPYGHESAVLLSCVVGYQLMLSRAENADLRAEVALLRSEPPAVDLEGAV